MFGSSRQVATRLRTAPSTRVAVSQRLGFERLDERVVLSAAPWAAMPAVDQPAPAEAAALESAEFNFAPQGTDNLVFMSSNTYNFTADDFGFSDPGDIPPDLFQAVRITTIPTRGTLFFAGSGVANGQFIPANQLNDLRYTVSDVEDPSYASFTFQVQDDGGTVSGGNDLDPSPNTFTFFFESPETNFISGLYQDLLERNPDPAGLINWLNALDGGASRLDVARMLWETPEHRGEQVDDYYQRFFEREPDALGRQVWIDLMLNGMPEETVMARFMTTVEYQALNPSIEGYVNAAYADLLGRLPDVAGQNFWVTALANDQFTRAEVAQLLIDTRERHLLLVDSYYDEFLNREPDSSGLFFWVDQLDENQLDDQAVAQLLLATDEYYNLANPL